jgi:Icc-related predicted phosphoesterase
MIIDCISDLHGHYPELKGGDLLIVAGDLTAHDNDAGYLKFYAWLHKQEYKKYVIIAGNHDHMIEWGQTIIDRLDRTHYLQDSGTEFDGLKIWGSPWTLSFEGMNPQCTAFTVETEEELSEKWALIPNDIDILVTHCPPRCYLDLITLPSGEDQLCGSASLNYASTQRIKPKYHIFGHIHEHGGRFFRTEDTLFINASYVNEYYEPINTPIRIHDYHDDH